MRNLLLILGCLLMAGVDSDVVDPGVGKHEYFTHLTSEDDMPANLLATYVRFVEAARAGKDLSSLILPNAVLITTDEREDKMKEYGGDLNIPFLTTGFSPDVYSAVREGDDIWLFRTGTSVLWFVQTKNGGWFLYKYFDKPIA